MEALKDFYEEEADRFWDPVKGMTGRDLDVYPLLSESSGSVIEYGSGSGSLIYNLALEHRFTECVGIDISEKAIKSLKECWDSNNENKDKLKTYLPQNDGLPNLSPSSFDLLITVATVEHVINPYTVLDELHRLAAKDAALICSVPNYGYIKHIVHLLMGKQPRTGTDHPVEDWRDEGWDGMHLHTFTKSSFATLLRDCGWEPEVWRGCGSRLNWTGLGYLRKYHPRLWSGELIVRCRKI